MDSLLNSKTSIPLPLPTSPFPSPKKETKEKLRNVNLSQPGSVKFLLFLSVWMSLSACLLSVCMCFSDFLFIYLSLPLTHINLDFDVFLPPSLLRYTLFLRLSVSVYLWCLFIVSLRQLTVTKPLLNILADVGPVILRHYNSGSSILIIIFSVIQNY